MKRIVHKILNLNIKHRIIVINNIIKQSFKKYNVKN